MVWTKEEKEKLDKVVIHASLEDDVVFGVANNALELAAERGGTMTEVDLDEMARNYEGDGPNHLNIRRMLQHISALGARNAALEADLARVTERANNLDVALSERTKSYQSASFERDAALKRADSLAAHLSTMRARAEHAETRVRELAIAGQELSAAVDKHVGAPLGPYEMARNAIGGEVALAPNVERYPCSPTCTHDDAKMPGHPERVKERSEAWNAMHPNGSCTCAGEGICSWCDDAARAEDKSDAYDRGAEAMRAACWEAVLGQLHVFAMAGGIFETAVKKAIEGATP